MRGKRNNKNKRSYMRNRLLCYLLSGALALTNLAVIPALSVSAAESTEQDNGNQEILHPKIVVRNYKELALAIDEAGDGDIIGIDNIIELNSDVSMLGNSEKRLTICRMSENSYISVNLSADVKVENIIFDGRGVAFGRCYVPMFQVDGKVNFENVTFQNCYNNWSGGAIVANGGEMKITGCCFTNNRASEGGHLVVQSAKVSVQNSVFENGIAENGGGAVNVGLIYGYDNGIEFNNCRLVGNQAKFGGAIANHGNVKIINSVVYGNQAKSATEFINYMDSSFQIDSIEEVTELYKRIGIVPKKWIYDYDNKSYINGEIDKTNPNAALKLVYEEITKENNSENGGSEKDDSKGDTAESEQPKDENRQENDNKEDSVADNKDENNTGGDTVSDGGNADDSNSEQSKPEGGTAADSDSNKEDEITDGKENQENQEDKQENQGNVGDTGNNENKDGSSSALDTTTSPSGGNKQPDSTVNNGNQGGTSGSNIGNNSSNNNQNQPNKPVTDNGNNMVNNPSDNTNGGSGSSTVNGNTSDNTSQGGGNVPSKPENNQDNNSGSSDNGGTAAIAGNTQTVASNTNKDDSGNKNIVTAKKVIKELLLTAKKGERKITGKTVKKAAIKIRIGNKTYKVKSNAKGKFTIKLKGEIKLKKGQKIKITVAKKGYKSISRTFKVK